MAYTATLNETDVFGNKRAYLYSVTADAQSGAVFTGLNEIVSIATSLKSCNSAGFKIKRNVGSATTTGMNGHILISGCTSGDAFEMIVIGS